MNGKQVQTRYQEIQLKKFDHICQKLGVKRGRGIHIAMMEWQEKHKNLLKENKKTDE